MADGDGNHNGPPLRVLGDSVSDEHEGDVCQDDPGESNSRPIALERIEYNSKKPRWWRQMAGRRGTKPQRRAIAEMRAFHLPKAPYGSMINWESIFPTFQEIWLEIGMGQGDNLLANAERHPNIGMVGADLHQPGMGIACQRMQQAMAQNDYWRGYSLYDISKDPYHCEVEPNQLQQLGDSYPNSSSNPIYNHDATATTTTSPYSNIRLYCADGMKLLHYIPDSSLSAILVTFPDPWPREDQTEYRVIQVSTVRDLHRVLKKDGGSFYLATDHEGFYDWCNSVFGTCSKLFRQVLPCPVRSEWLPVISKYEQKGWNEGRQTLLACWKVQ